MTEGCDVWIIARDLIIARGVCGAEGIRYLQAPVLTGRSADYIARPRTFAHILHNAGFNDDSQLATMTVAWRNIFDLIKPDIVVCEHAPTALFASCWSGAMLAVIGTGFFSPPDLTPLPDLYYWSPRPSDDFEQHEQVILDRLNRLLVRDRLHAIDRLAQLYSDVSANWLLTFRELDHYPQRQQADYYGMWCWDRGIPPKWPAGDGPKIFAYLKVPAPNWNLDGMLNVLRELEMPTLAYIAGAEPRWLRKYASERLHFSNTPFRLREVVGDCSLAIINGNAGTSTSLLLAGIPQLLIPLYLEQCVYSQRVVDLGAGMQAASNQPEQMQARILDLLNSERYAVAAATFAKRNAEHDAERSIGQIVGRICSL